MQYRTALRRRLALRNGRRIIGKPELETMMKLLDLAELKASYAAGHVTSVVLHAVQAAFEVRWTTEQCVASLVDRGSGEG